MARKPKFSELPESEFQNDIIPVESSSSSAGSPTVRARKPSSQSEESKYIKRINENVKALYNYIPGEDNNYISGYIKAFKAAGVETTKKIVNGYTVEVVRNTKENREKAADLMKALYEENVKSMSDIRKTAIRHLREQGLKATKSNIDYELETMSSYATLESNLTFAYNAKASGSRRFQKYVDRLRGASRKADPRAYDQAVRDLAAAVGKEREKERRKAYSQAGKILVDEDDVK